MAHAVVTLVGLLILLYPFTLGAHPAITCRGVEIRAGQSCAKADHSGVRTYEQSRRAADQAKPVVVGVGLLVAAFGAVLLAGDRSRRGSAEESVKRRGRIG